MLSRRNIRIKVMQMLYTMSRDKELTYKEALSRYDNGIEESYVLFLFNLNYLVNVARYSLKDADRRLAKHLPTEEDKSFKPKLFDNEIIQSIASHVRFNDLVEELKFEEGIDQDTVRKVYVAFSKTPEYQAYLNKDCTIKDDRDILLFLFKYCINHELFNEAIEDRYATWVDDKSLVVGTIKKTLKGLPDHKDFVKIYKPTEETTKEFGETLFQNVIKNNEELLEIIEPALNNWDADRVAIIDMILLKMAISELMIFPSIPTKVTLNEFVEISKMYSTDKSKDFINGILDRLMKMLKKDGRISKEGRGLLE
jgi:transcription antitermination protein NusB